MKLFRKVLVGILAIAGFSACGNNSGPKVEYGCPHATLKVNATVVDEDGNPVGNAKLLLKDLEKNNDLCMVETGEDGTVSDTLQLFADLRLTSGANVVYYGEDNAEHSGKFKDDSVTVKAEQIEEGKGTWENGTYEINVNLKLTKKGK